ncbi:MAG TPA: SRPBCC family protein [Nitrolancea sp.]
MESVTKSINVNVPVRVAYDQWTQFEEFPKFMEGVQEVRQLDDKRLHWRAEISGKTKEWDATITEQIPDQRVAWSSTGGAPNDGVVVFRPLGPDSTEVTLQMGYEPESVTEKVGDALGMVDRQVEGDLRRFKDFIEQRGFPTGGWRGSIEEHP